MSGEMKLSRKRNRHLETIEKRKKYQEIAKAWDKLAEKQNNRIIVNEKIWTASDTSPKRCEHCLNISRSNRCSVHKTQVADNNCCDRFYSPKLYYGGSFSPR